MSLPGLMPKAPKIDKATKAAQEAQRAAESERIRQLKEEQLARTKGQMAGSGIRSLITSVGGGYGRNFF
jgi:hypothetical protein